LLERELASIPMHGTSPWRRKEQEKGTGIPTPIGMRLWRGSDGWASMKGSSGRARSTRRCSGRRGEGRRGAVSVVWRGRGGGAFYRLREEARRSSEGGRWPAAIEVDRGFNVLVMTLEVAVGKGKWGGRTVLFCWSRGAEAVSGKAPHDIGRGWRRLGCN
jgi:hypothetical protein